jgi:glycogen operon protein
VSYNDKHNEANGEENRDGESHNRSWNLGAEGPTEDAGINLLRARQKRNFLATLLLSQGVPMILGGDELGRTQHGNNNAYCQDSEISWYDWENADGALIAFTQQLIAFRAAHPVFRRRGWFKGRRIHGKGVSDVAWFKSDGAEMAEEDWGAGFIKSFMVFFNGNDLAATDERGRRLKDDSFLLLFNAHTDAVTFTLPGRPWGGRWVTEIDTAADPPFDGGDARDAGAALERPGLSLMVLRRG